ncbi:MAG: hypothetical protein ACREGD_01715 [Candidatus Saccharimonadales bacterium]
MVQFNLLPDIKVQYLKARRQKRLFMTASTVVIIGTVVIIAVLSSFVFGVQRKSLNDLSRDIDQKGAALSSTPDLDRILTVQNQLKSLPGLHNDKAVAGRLYGYVSQITPADATIARLHVDFAKNTISISGSASSLEVVNVFTDTLKFTQFTTAKNNTAQQAFSSVVLSSFGRDEEVATYTITAAFDPAIFSELEEVKLTVPNVVTTRSEVAQPAALFQQQTGEQGE